MPSQDRPDLQRFLNRLTNRSVLSKEEQDAILNLPGTFEHLESNRDFVCLGKPVEHACLITAGLVGRFEQNSQGERQITAIYIPGDMADLHSVVQPIPTSALQALSRVTVFRVPHAALRGLVSRYPAIAEAFWRDCMVDAAILSQWVVNVGRRDARQRIAHLLCELATRLEVAPSDGWVIYPFAVTQAQLADATGLTSVHVNRVLKSLRERDIADVSGRTVRAMSFAALAAAGDFDATYLQEDTRPEQRMRLVQAS